MKMFLKDLDTVTPLGLGRANSKGIAYSEPRNGGFGKAYSYYNWYWRELAYVEMTAAERMGEVVHICCTKYLEGEAKNEFGALANPASLSIMVGIMLVFMATVGGWVAALRVFVGALLAGSGFHVDYEFWRDKWATVSSFVNNRHLRENLAANAADQAGKALAEGLTKLLADFCMAKFGHSVGKAMGDLRGLFVRKTAADWEAAGRQAAEPPPPVQASKSKPASKVEQEVADLQRIAANNRKPRSKEWMRKYFEATRRGVLGLNVGIKGLRKAKSAADVNLREGEYKGYCEISKAGNGNCLVLRDPGPHRLKKLEQGVIALSKDIEVVAKSFTADRVGMKLEKFFGYVGVGKKDIKHGELVLVKEVKLTDFDSSLPKGNFKAYKLDPRKSAVKGMKSAQESRGVVKDGTLRGTTRAEAKAVREQHGLKVLEDTLFVDVGEGKFIIMSKGTGMPSISDVDMLAAAPVKNGWLGTPQDGISLTGRANKPRPGDDPELGRQLNEVMQRNCQEAGHTNMGSYNHFNHSERGGSAVLVDKNGVPMWNPVDKGQPPDERLIMFLKGECHVFDDWKSYKAFCSLNGLEKMCPWDW